MSENLPVPPVPADASLSDLPYMPLYKERLNRSRAWRDARRQPEIGFYLINLWLAAFFSRPFGSLPDDDDELCDTALCEIRRWPKVREKVMRGWTKCADGRMYHPVVVEIALEVWGKRKEYKDRAAVARKAKEAKRAAVTGSITDTVTDTDTEPVTDLTSALKGKGKVRVREESPPTPQGGGMVVARFLELRRTLWPHEGDERLVLLTLKAQADQYLDVSPAALVIEVIEKAMRQMASAAKSPPMNLRFCHRSMTDAAATHRQASVSTAPIKHSAVVWANRLRVWTERPDAAWLSSWHIHDCPPEALTAYSEQLRLKPPPGYQPPT